LHSPLAVALLVRFFQILSHRKVKLVSSLKICVFSKAHYLVFLQALGPKFLLNPIVSGRVNEGMRITDKPLIGVRQVKYVVDG